MNKIDVVITWVDGADPRWLESRKQFRLSHEMAIEGRDDATRFRDWDNLQYIFRGIEKYMSWVNHIFLVTVGHYPKWLNLENPRLTLVKHDEFIPHQYLPTFNSNVIDLNLFRITGLSEQFVYFNDDTFVIDKTKAEDFFVDGLPCDTACISPQPIQRDMIRNIEINNLKILNDHFGIEDVRKNKWKWTNFFKYRGFALRSLLFMQFSTIIGIFEPHMPLSHLKSNFSRIWNMEYDEFDSTCHHHFRSTEDINQWLVRNWMLLEGRFVPRSVKFGTYINSNQSKETENLIKRHGSKLICINDGSSSQSFDEDKRIINDAFENILSGKSSFEL